MVDRKSVHGHGVTEARGIAETAPLDCYFGHRRNRAPRSLILGFNKKTVNTDFYFRRSPECRRHRPCSGSRPFRHGLAACTPSCRPASMSAARARVRAPGSALPAHTWKAPEIEHPRAPAPRRPPRAFDRLRIVDARQPKKKRCPGRAAPMLPRRAHVRTHARTHVHTHACTGDARRRKTSTPQIRMLLSAWAHTRNCIVMAYIVMALVGVGTHQELYSYGLYSCAPCRHGHTPGTV